MRISPPVIATMAIVATLVGASAVGCSNDSKPSTPSSGSAAPTHPAISDYTTLLIKAEDIKAPDAFTAGPATKNPNGQQGATITFTDADHSHSIIDTIADPAGYRSCRQCARFGQGDAPRISLKPSRCGLKSGWEV